MRMITFDQADLKLYGYVKRLERRIEALERLLEGDKTLIIVKEVNGTVPNED